MVDLTEISFCLGVGLFLSALILIGIATIFQVIDLLILLSLEYPILPFIFIWVILGIAISICVYLFTD